MFSVVVMNGPGFAGSDVPQSPAGIGAPPPPLAAGGAPPTGAAGPPAALATVPPWPVLGALVPAADGGGKLFPLLPGVALLPARGVVGPTAVFPPAAELRPALALPSGGDALLPACVPVVAGVFVPGGVPHAIPSAVKSIKVELRPLIILPPVHRC